MPITFTFAVFTATLTILSYTSCLHCLWYRLGRCDAVVFYEVVGCELPETKNDNRKCLELSVMPLELLCQGVSGCFAPFPLLLPSGIRAWYIRNTLLCLLAP